MQVHRVVVPGSRVESWTVLGDDGVPVAAVGVLAGVPEQHRQVTEHGQGLCRPPGMPRWSRMALSSGRVSGVARHNRVRDQSPSRKARRLSGAL